MHTFLYTTLLTCLSTAAISGCSHTASTNDNTTINGHLFVDLQLPSGLLWAETNIGAQTSTEDGEYYAWAETQTKSDYSQTAYRYGTSFENMTKYNETDGKTTLEPEDDVATVRWGAPCRIPTYAEFQELADTANCSWRWTKIAVTPNDTVMGYQVTSKRNGNSIFLPASGARNGKSLYLRNENGAYWTSTRGTETAGTAFDLCFYFANFSWYRNDRPVGHTIRAVAPGTKQASSIANNQ